MLSSRRGGRRFPVRLKELADPLRWKRPANQVALHISAAVRGDARQLLFGFDTLRKRCHAEALAQSCDSADDGHAARIVGLSTDERLIDLDLVERKACLLYTSPTIADGVMRISPAMFAALFEGLDWRLVRPEEARRPKAAG